MLATNAPARPASRYYGSKWRLARWIIGYMPAHTVYVEPYAGVLAVLLNKQRSIMEIVSDVSDEIVNYFQILRERPDELLHLLWLTPFAEQELAVSCEPTDDPLERARRFYVRAYQSIEGPICQGNHHFRRQSIFSRGKNGRGKMKPAAASFVELDHLYDIAARLRGVQIWDKPALEVLERCDAPDALFYVDPPYVTETRNGRYQNTYELEMDEDDHRELAAALHATRGMVLLSGYDCPLYRELYADWPRMTTQARTNGNGTREESLWLNPATAAALEQERNTMAGLPLFDR